VRSAAVLLPGEPDLDGMLETELARNLIGQQRSLRHQQADQVVGQQIDPQLFDGHLRGLAPQVLHAESRLNIAQIQLDIPLKKPL